MDDVKDDLDRYGTRARDKAEATYREGKEKGRGVWGNIQDFFGRLFSSLSYVRVLCYADCAGQEIVL